MLQSFDYSFQTGLSLLQEHLSMHWPLGSLRIVGGGQLYPGPGGYGHGSSGTGSSQVGSHRVAFG